MVGGRPISDSETETEDDALPPDGIQKDKDISRRNDGDVSEVSVFSSDEDPGAAYKEFRARKAPKRKSEAGNTGHATKRQRGAAKGRSAAASIVGIQPTRARAARQKKWSRRRSSDENEEDEYIESKLPQYIKTRQKNFTQGKDKLGTSGLRLPPDYNDIEFSDDDDDSMREIRPQFPDLQPVAPDADIPLPFSAGVIPAPIAKRLRSYQVDGAAFLHELFVYQKGGILGDDMGLGKTIQVIAFLTAAFSKTGDSRDDKRMRKMRRQQRECWYPRVLIICPGALMDNWRDELNRWGWWHTDTFHGSTIDKENALQAAITGRLEILITTYTTYRQNRESLNIVDWDCVIADECHMIKERSSETTRAMDQVNALCRIGLTGTAIQNKYEELWTLLNWCNPGQLGALASWKKEVSEPLRLGQSHDATVPELARARKTAKQLVQNLLPQFFLRRMKSLIADQLPRKTDRVVFCPLTDTQQTAYQQFVSTEMVDAIRLSSEPCDCDSGRKRGWCCYRLVGDDERDWRPAVFTIIATLQKLSNHLALLIPSSNDAPEQQTRMLDQLQDCMPEQWRSLFATRDSIIHYANQDFCGKWRILKKLLKFWHGAGDCKVLVFSHSVRLLRMLHQLFASTTAYSISYLDGSMTLAERSAAVNEFNTSPDQFVFLISARAGGVGLNITSANKVVIVDPHWNPAHDLQAQDRAYRIGQVRDVEVFRLLSAGTIEEIVYARQIYKQQQANIGYSASNERRYFSGVQNAKDKKGEIFGLRNMFAYHGEHLVLRDIVNKLNIAESKAGIYIASLDVNESSASSATKDEDDYDLTGGPDTSLEEEDVGAGELQDSAMSQLASLITDGDGSNDETNNDRTTGIGSKARNTMRNSKQHRNANPVHAILAGAGVSYTHDNSEVIGSSRVEARLSRRAEAAAAAGTSNIAATKAALATRVFEAEDDGPGFEEGVSELTGKAEYDAEPLIPKLKRESSLRVPSEAFRAVDADLDVDFLDDSAVASPVQSRTHEPVVTNRAKKDTALLRKYRPPLSVRQRQLVSMATFFGYAREYQMRKGGDVRDVEKTKVDETNNGGGLDNGGGISDTGGVTAFALTVEAATQAQRRDMLDKFYAAGRIGTGG